MKLEEQGQESPKFVGREIQLEELKKVLDSNRPEFIAVYGRRRVGKTFLVKEAANNDFAFYFTASCNITKRQQLNNFALQLRNYSNAESVKSFNDWFFAFNALGDYLDNLPKNVNKIIFLDEIPWADSPKSGFLSALENFWNVRCAFHNDIKVVVCGSATSWILNKIIHNRGGLYGRLTHSFRVEPFNLYEASLYFKEYGYSFSKSEIAEIYMILGGIPYYYSFLENGESIAKNIDRLFFSMKGKLRTEFQNLYESLYKNHEIYIKVIEQLAKVGTGMSRQDLIRNLKIKGNGSFSSVLHQLEECGFIRSYLPFESKRNKVSNRTKTHALFQLIDLYSLFYLKFIHENQYFDENYWSANYTSPTLNTWRGLAFETLCLWHLPQIKEGLGIAGVSARACSWRGSWEDMSAQIDLLIDRKDNVINICEMKYSDNEFIITKEISKSIKEKLNVFLMASKTRKTPVITFITPDGVKRNSHSDIAQKVITLPQLFKY